ncbi:MAG TPA: Rieske 2Fe-2S domain-containing protein, partial [Casimicrobiaceae bacterium]
MPDLIEIARPASLAPGQGVRVTIAEHCAVALFDVEGRMFAIDDLCVRCGTSLAEGTLTDTVVSCIGCDWRYDVKTGCVNG